MSGNLNKAMEAITEHAKRNEVRVTGVRYNPSDTWTVEAWTPGGTIHGYPIAHDPTVEPGWLAADCVGPVRAHSQPDHAGHARLALTGEIRLPIEAY